MPYTRQVISAEVQRSVHDDSNSHKRRWLDMRGFMDFPHGEWAKDQASGNYLVGVPTYIARGLDRNYFMRFNGTTYAIRVKDGRGPEVAIDDPVSNEDLSNLQAEITAAFAVLRLMGREFTPQFVSAWPARALD